MLDAMSIELDAFVDEHVAFQKLHRQTGPLLVAEALQAVQTDRNVRTRNGKVSTTDEPFAEAKMQPGGVFLINVGDLAAATRQASKIPSACLQSVEVRSIWALEQPWPRTRHW